MGKIDGKVFAVMSGRKIFIWLLSLAAVFVVYRLYTRRNETPPLIVEPAVETDEPAERPSEQVGMIGDVGVRTVQKAKYTHLDSKKRVDREFGFEKLLHETGNEWEIEKPFMNIYQPKLRCYITANKGDVLLEHGVGGPSPKDATLTGNVVIHIIPEKGGSIKESFIYLDDVTYIGERSEFTTDGPVEFINADARMLGRGLRLVYNEEKQRLESLRIVHLDNLKLRLASQQRLSSPPKTTTEADSTVTTDEQPTQAASAEPVETAVETKAEDKTLPARSEYYRCLFSENVLINCPEQVIFSDEVFINNMLRSSSSDEDEPPTQDDGATTASAPEEEQAGVDAPAPEKTGDTEAAEEFVDIVVTCDNGIFVTSMDAADPYAGMGKENKDSVVTASERAKSFGDIANKATLVAQRIDYCLISDQITMQGNCVCKMPEYEENVLREYMLSAPKVTVQLSRDKDGQSDALADDIEHVRAEGGTVQLATVKKSPEGQLLGFTKLKCLQFDYDAGLEIFLATGPGLMAVDNSKVPQTKQQKKDKSKLGLRKQCYAILRDFDTLQYSPRTNQLTADAGSESILIDYIPVAGDQYGEQIAVAARHVVADMFETEQGQTEVSELTATGGITYQEKEMQFAGSRLFYDAGSSLITVEGDEYQPCMLNGGLVDGIEYDLKTERVKAHVVSPGVLRSR